MDSKLVNIRVIRKFREGSVAEFMHSKSDAIFEIEEILLEEEKFQEKEHVLTAYEYATIIHSKEQS